MVIIDTTVWIDYFKGETTPHTDWLEEVLDQQRLGLTDLILCEVLQGVRSDRQWTQVSQELSRFEIFPTGGIALSLAAAQNYRQLRAQGYTVRKTIDCLIATFCLKSGHLLLHNDRDFDPFEKALGLLVIHPNG
ncbi:MAG: PIN domain nuclease [Candidatus Handelsmanbacteria bacterium]|nr:PIN domain nuclease [Candidatus Handelsmanbacteria bacterium]